MHPYCHSQLAELLALATNWATRPAPRLLPLMAAGYQAKGFSLEGLPQHSLPHPLCLNVSAPNLIFPTGDQCYQLLSQKDGLAI